MVLQREPGAEPIPGYRLLHRLGRGGFGEVWSAQAPGGIHKAIKFVVGKTFAPATVDNVGQEFQGLARMREVRHPYVLSIDRFEIVDEQLVVVMELADRDLHQRWREARQQGLAGIPRGELLKYLAEAAEALDLMNAEYGVQHLDIKPANIFLVRNHVKVADFGLAKDLTGFSARVAGGMTPIYAAPETFDGWVSRNTDQYSLAIVYQEMLTGTRPFGGPTSRQYMLQHLTSEPRLDVLPADDRDAIALALAKNPEHRHFSCTDFIAALQRANGPETLAWETVKQSAPAALVVELSTAEVPPANTRLQESQSASHAEGHLAAASTESSDEARETPEFAEEPATRFAQEAFIPPFELSPEDQHRAASFKQAGTLPDLTMELLGLLFRVPAATVPEVAAILARSSKLGEGLLALANHASWGRSWHLANVPRVITVLGPDQTIVLHLLQVLGQSRPWQAAGVAASKADWARRRCLWLAALAFGMVKNMGEKEKLCPYTALALGLLQDLGILSLLQGWPRRYHLYVTRFRHLGPDSLVVNERAWFGFTHADVSAALLQLWNMPEEIIRLVGAHHHMERLAGVALPWRGYGSVLAVAEAFVNVLQDDFDSRLPALRERLGSWKGLPRGRWRKVVADGHVKAVELHGLLGLSLPLPPATREYGP